MSALDLIIKWAESLPAWQSDIVRRLLTQTVYSEKDQSEAIDMIKSEFDLIEDKTKIIQPKRLTKGDISGVVEPDIKIALKAIKCVSGVNAIPENSTLHFAANGLNIIYGGNGSAAVTKLM